MIEIARARHPDMDFRVDPCAELRTLDTEHFDLVIANYVLMDTPDLRGTMTAFHRILKPDGVAVLVFSHPCFPQAHATVSHNGEEITYSWRFPYFERRKCIDPSWAHFTSEFIWFHRPLSDYWKAFMAAGFVVVDFEEPRITAERYHRAKTESELKDSQTRPFSVVFKLQKSSEARDRRRAALYRETEAEVRRSRAVCGMKSLWLDHVNTLSPARMGFVGAARRDDRRDGRFDRRTGGTPRRHTGLA